MANVLHVLPSGVTVQVSGQAELVYGVSANLVRRRSATCCRASFGETGQQSSVIGDPVGRTLRAPPTWPTFATSTPGVPASASGCWLPTRTTRRYDPRHALDRHATYTLAAFIAEVLPSPSRGAALPHRWR
jgi:hypothetical protein